MELLLQLIGAACATVLVGHFFAIAIDGVKHRLTQRDD
jgi:hypothetical protein